MISVVIPTYNRNELLFDRALASVMRQSVTDLEIHVVADGMVGTQAAELEARAAELHDPRLYIWHIPRQQYPEDPAQRWCVLGLNARNHGLDHATGDWIAPLDDDDRWTDDHLQVLLNAAEESGAQFVYGMSQYHWPDGRPQLAGSWPPGMGAFCDGAQIYRNGLGYRYDPGCIERGLPEDGDMWIRMLAGGVTFALTRRIVHHYYPNPR